MNLIKLSGFMSKNRIIYDCWNLHNKKIKDRNKISYVSLGNH